ncbi:ABC transporter ATP-binding protein [Rhodoluna limnophila]|uniref:ABC transporter ATP-binding protein n=1 Tax=Rhodoluna limnophila TaxID=232537 RepID=UPI0011062414|nr:ABC transporter ATP-binding protein [Rhodoluna limnophila]
MSRVIDLNNVTVVREGRNILNNVDWQVEPNQRWVIVGPNGAGKTTLLRVAAAQIHPTHGQATILGERMGEINVFELRTRIGFASSALAAHIPNSESVLNAVMTASYGVTGRWNEKYEDIDERRARRVLSEWQLSEFADRAFGTLSDGERKRTQIARAVMPDPEVLLLDEPVASLDLAAREQTINIIGEYASHPMAPAMVMVTHHLEEIPEGFTHALLIRNGEIFAAGDIHNTLTSEKISEVFGFGLKVDYEDGRFRVRAHKY